VANGKDNGLVPLYSNQMYKHESTTQDIIRLLILIEKNTWPLGQNSEVVVGNPKINKFEYATEFNYNYTPIPSNKEWMKD
jgi:hypothetical protein